MKNIFDALSAHDPAESRHAVIDRVAAAAHSIGATLTGGMAVQGPEAPQPLRLGTDVERIAPGMVVPLWTELQLPPEPPTPPVSR